jgi:hypothetical protein
MDFLQDRPPPTGRLRESGSPHERAPQSSQSAAEVGEVGEVSENLCVYLEGPVFNSSGVSRDEARVSLRL